MFDRTAEITTKTVVIETRMQGIALDVIQIVRRVQIAILKILIGFAVVVIASALDERIKLAARRMPAGRPPKTGAIPTG